MTQDRTHDVRNRFDRVAGEWDQNPTRVALAAGITNAIRQNIALTDTMHVMDFGAGTGLVTLGILPFVNRVTAADTSPEMLRVLNEKVKKAGITSVTTLCYEPGGPGLPTASFDAIVSSMVLHHIADVGAMIQTLRTCLRPGGQIALADLDTEDGSFHPDPTGVFHHGFSRDRIRQWVSQAGFTQVAIRDAYRIERPGSNGVTRHYPVFLVTGQAA